MHDIKEIAVMTAMDAMFRKGYLDICTIREAVKMLRVIPNGEALDTLAILHCVHFKDMPLALLEELPKLLGQCMSGVPLPKFEALTKTQLLRH
jgi:hypothetical protein